MYFSDRQMFLVNRKIVRHQVDEEWQARVLEMAWDGYFDQVADLDMDGNMIFLKRDENTVCTSPSSDVADFIHSSVSSIYHCPVATPCSNPNTASGWQAMVFISARVSFYFVTVESNHGRVVTLTFFDI